MAPLQDEFRFAVRKATQGEYGHGDRGPQMSDGESRIRVPAPREGTGPGVVGTFEVPVLGERRVLGHQAAREHRVRLPEAARRQVGALRAMKEDVPRDEAQGILAAGTQALADVMVKTTAEGPKVIFGGYSPGDPELHSTEVSRHVPYVARVEAVRKLVRKIQREILAHGGVILAGRDIGT